MKKQSIDSEKWSQKDTFSPFDDFSALTEPSLYHEIVSTTRFLPLRCFFSNDQKPSCIPPHFHEELEFIHLLSGELSVTINQKKFTVHPGDTILFNTNTIHSTYSKRNDTTAYVLLLPYEHLRRCLPAPETFTFELPLLSRDEITPEKKEGLEKLAGILSSLCTLCKEQPAFYQVQALRFVYELIYLLCTAFPSPGKPAAAGNDYRYYDRLHTLTAYIHDHYREPLTLEELASLISVTPAYLSRFFKNSLHLTVTEYLTSVRMEHAYTDLITTDYSIREISENNGFSSYAFFVRKFKEAYRTTPLKVRKASEL